MHHHLVGPKYFPSSSLAYVLHSKLTCNVVLQNSSMVPLYGCQDNFFIRTPQTQLLTQHRCSPALSPPCNNSLLFQSGISLNAIHMSVMNFPLVLMYSSAMIPSVSPCSSRMMDHLECFHERINISHWILMDVEIRCPWIGLNQLISIITRNRFMTNPHPSPLQ